jgi:hypothetical protein
MYDFFYWELTGSVPFDLPWSVISWLAISGWAFKLLMGVIYGRRW